MLTPSHIVPASTDMFPSLSNCSFKPKTGNVINHVLPSCAGFLTLCQCLHMKTCWPSGVLGWGQTPDTPAAEFNTTFYLFVIVNVQIWLNFPVKFEAISNPQIPDWQLIYIIYTSIMYWWQLALTGRWDSFQMRPRQTGSTQAALFYSTCCWLEVPWWRSQTARKKASGGGWGGGGGHRLPASTHPHVHWHEYWVYTDMYSYLQVSSLNFKLVTVCKSSQPYFPILKLSCVFHAVQIFTSFFKFFTRSVSLPASPCFAKPHCGVFFSSSWHSEFFTTLLVCTASARHISTQLASVEVV